jgi:uncharacterized protein with PQ loop repeat
LAGRSALGLFPGHVRGLEAKATYEEAKRHYIYRFLQYLWYHVRDRSSPAHLSHPIRNPSAAIPVDHESDGFLPPHYSRTALASATTSAIFHILFLGPSLFFATSPPQYGPGYFIIMQIWSWINICVSGLLAFIHFLPQIYYTWSLERVESLSISTMIMQVPAYFLLAASLALRFQIDSSENVFANYTDRAIAWVNYLCSGCEQSILLGLSIMYIMPGKGMLSAEESEQGEEGGGEDNPPAEENAHEDAGERPSCPPDEQTPLLSNDPGRASS